MITNLLFFDNSIVKKSSERVFILQIIVYNQSGLVYAITFGEGILMKKRLFALLLVMVLLVPAGIAAAATYYRVNTTSLQVRMQPSESGKVLASYRRDSVATVSSSKDGWSYVTFVGGTKGYVQTRYLSKASSYAAWSHMTAHSSVRSPTAGPDPLPRLRKAPGFPFFPTALPTIMSRPGISVTAILSTAG